MNDDSHCDNCGTATPIHLLDGKPGRLAGRRATRRQIKKALARGDDFDRLECRRCYGPCWQPGEAG